MRKIAVGDLGEFWYGDYKEPFEQLEGGVPGHPVGVVLKDDAGKLLCAYCGKTFDNLGSHVSKTHGMPAATYKAEVGLLSKSALISEAVRRKRIAQGLRNVRDGKVFDGMKTKSQWPQGKPQPLRGRKSPAYTPERLNKTGRCMAQVLTVARQIVAQRGRVSQADLSRHGIGPKTIAAYFGDIDGLRKVVGGARRLTDEQVLTALRSLAEKLGRTPAASDMRRYGMPSKGLYEKRFGSWNTACQKAGLVPNLTVSRDESLDSAILTAYSITGSIHKVAASVGSDATTVCRILRLHGVELRPGPWADRKAQRDWAATVAARIEGLEEAA